MLIDHLCYASEFTIHDENFSIAEQCGFATGKSDQREEFGTWNNSDFFLGKSGSLMFAGLPHDSNF